MKQVRVYLHALFRLANSSLHTHWVKCEHELCGSRGTVLLWRCVSCIDLIKNWVLTS